MHQKIAVLASLTSVPPGVRANNNSFVKTCFYNLSSGAVRGAHHTHDSPSLSSMSSAPSMGAAPHGAHGHGNNNNTFGAVYVHKKFDPHNHVYGRSDSMDAEDQDDDASVQAADLARAALSPEFIEKIVAVLRHCHPEGILGSQFPEAYRRLYGEKLVLEDKKGRRLKLLHVLDGHPNVRKEQLGAYKWFYRETPGSGSGAGNSPSAGVGANMAFTSSTGSKTMSKAEAKAALLAAKLAARATAAQSKLGGMPVDSGFHQTQAPASGGAAPPANYEPGIEGDLLPASSYPSVAWLRDYNMEMFRWAGNAKEWTEYAMRLQPSICAVLEAPESDILSSLRQCSGCEISIGSDTLYGKSEKFLVFVRGDSGQPSNAAMTRALEMFGNLLMTDLRGYLGTSPSHNAISVTSNKASSRSGSYTGYSASSEEPNYDDAEDEDDDVHSHEAGKSDHIEGRVHRVLEIPQSSVGLIAGKGGKRLYAMRKKSGAYIALVSKGKNRGPAKLTISGSAASVEVALNLVKVAITSNGPGEDGGSDL
jgi:KH domain